MRINQIYITKEGEPMANPEMELPPRPHHKGEEQWSAPMLDWHSGLLPFEGIRGSILYKILYRLGGQTAKESFYDVCDKCFDADGKLKPDTIIPVDLEVEVVRQYRYKGREEWIEDFMPDETIIGASYRKVLRIKP